MKINLSFMTPAIRVHTWGGYGSQLFTAYLLLKLKRRFPNRRIKAINHTSGVTRRVTEFDFDSLGVNVVQTEDYETARLSTDLLDFSPQFSQSFRV